MEVSSLLPQWVDVTRLLIAVGLTVLVFALGARAFSVRRLIDVVGRACRASGGPTWIISYGPQDHPGRA